MTVHVLDTGAVYLLHDRAHGIAARALRTSLTEDPSDHAFTPELVLLEAEQAKPLHRGRLDDILLLAGVPKQVAPREIASVASEALRKLKRASCSACGALLRPTLVDAWVVGFAVLYVRSGELTVIHTSDPHDLEALREALDVGPASLEVRACS